MAGVLLVTLWLGLGPAAPQVRGAELPAVGLAADTSVVFLGDPVLLTLTLQYGPEYRPAPLVWDRWLDGVWHQYRGHAGPAQTGGGLTETHRLEVRFFELGDQTVPPLAVEFTGADGQPLTRTAGALKIEVQSARTAGDEELREIKPPVSVPGGVPLWLAAVAAALLLLLLVLGVLALRRWRRRQAPIPVAPPPQPVDYAAEFVRIAGMGLVEKGEYKVFYSLLSDNLRRYLEQSLGVEAMEQTTGEITAGLCRTGLAAETVEQVREYLACADLAKFARMVPSIQVARRAPEAGIAALRAVEGFRRAREPLAAPTAPAGVG